VSATVWAGVALLGALGAVLRWRVSPAIAARARGGPPVGTLAVNLAGALALGLLVGLGVEGDALLLAGGGLLGSLTTFSTWLVEAVALPPRRAAAVVALAGAAGLAAAALGWALGAALT
jgi:CrcB protein